MPVTQSELNAFHKRLNSLIQGAFHLDDRIAKQINSLAIDMRMRIQNHILSVAEPRSTRIGASETIRLGQLVKMEVERFRIEATALMNRGWQDSANIGIKSTEEIANLLGQLRPAIPGITPEIAAIATGYSASLIQDISNEVLTQINGVLTRGLFGELTPYEAMKQIDTAMNWQGKTIPGGVSVKAERIVRTELTRARNASAHEGHIELQKQLDPELQPLLKKTWHSAHAINTRDTHLQAEAEYGEVGIPVDEPYMVGGFPMMFPGDSSMGAPPGETIN